MTLKELLTLNLTAQEVVDVIKQISSVDITTRLIRCVRRGERDLPITDEVCDWSLLHKDIVALSNKNDINARLVVIEKQLIIVEKRLLSMLIEFDETDVDKGIANILPLRYKLEKSFGRKLANPNNFRIQELLKVWRTQTHKNLNNI